MYYNISGKNSLENGCDLPRMGIVLKELLVFRWKWRQKAVMKMLFLTLVICGLYIMVGYHDDIGFHSATKRIGPIISMMKSGFHLDNFKDFSTVTDEEKYELMNNMRDSVDTLLKKCSTARPVCEHPSTGTKLLTLFTTWVYDKDKFLINSRTMKNWRTVLKHVNLVVFSNSSDVKRYSKLADFTVLPVTQEATGAPLLSAMFMAAKARFTSEFYGFANGDILFTDSLTKTLQTILCNIEEDFRQKGLLIVGRRINIPVTDIREEDITSSSNLVRISRSSGSLFQTDAEDYFITDKFYKWNEFLPVAIGRRGYDNWVVAYSRYNNITVIDATESVLCVHQTIESRGNYEGLSKGSYNLDLIDKLNLPFSFAAWGRTWCSSLKTWLDLCGQVVISNRSKVNSGCTSYYWSHSFMKLIGWRK